MRAWVALRVPTLPRGMYLTNAALMYLNYTTRIVAKSSKVIPTMLLGTLMQGRRWGRLHSHEIAGTVGGGGGG